ncbi:MAG TPA: AbrB/MazE/SpoVT family DNA-binding domain-containing protein [Thermodesulfobacteriota bacterium]|nr:AbrB/MazE/SpoVT family DNA-binding domain-containing protein [Thermodesulfobacteriota bacterium]
MKTTVTKRGQTVIPAELRRKYRIDEGAILEWIDTGMEIRVIPMPQDLIQALRGSAKGEKLTEKLLRTRREDKIREKR